MPFIEHVSDSDLERLALERFVPNLQAHGFSYVDGLLGEVAGDAVLEQVKDMHRSGALQDGRLAGSVPGIHRKSIRGDKIAWVSGSERGCEAISFLLNLIDKLVSMCASRLGNKAVRERSKVRDPTQARGVLISAWFRDGTKPSVDRIFGSRVAVLNGQWDTFVTVVAVLVLVLNSGSSEARAVVLPKQ